MTDPRLDHLVYAVPDLLRGVAEFAERTGVAPAVGGRHPGGTANYLVGFGETSYLEIVGPDPEADPGPQRPFFDLATLTEPRLITWAVQPADLDKSVRQAREQGYDPGDAEPLSRRTPDGALLEWRLTRRDDPAPVRPVPFLIDWGGTTHPAASGLPRLGLTAFDAVHPEPAALRRDLSALGVELDVTEGPEISLRAILDTPLGPVTLT
ncbi:VOC family protein [Nonomuraea guangzhouensis]|uniref:VOC family protein n=1 Tax=Nonomuraea guangzhouensis TaxID=1291555 RepID=A0ABW4GGK2_9ACTN|nr:VOC family protein [Nonomuraea guangzhouensis]